MAEKRCRKCGCLLEIGKNITKYKMEKTKSYICRNCWNEYMRNYLEIPKNRKLFNRRQKEKARELHDEVVRVLGSKCALCGRTKGDLKDKKIHFHAHEIYGKHGEDGNPKGCNPRWILNHVDRFVLLCPSCHRGVHWMMKTFNLKWKDIEKMLIKVYIGRDIYK